MTPLGRSIDNYAAGFEDGEEACVQAHGFLIDKARNEGHDACQATHRDLRRAWRHEATEERQRYSKMAHEYGYARGEARGRFQGALVVGLLVMAAVWWRQR